MHQAPYEIYAIDVLGKPHLKAAYEVAEEAHRGQKRKNSGRPAIEHLCLTRNILKEFGNNNHGNEMQQLIALLHDTIEDGYGKPEMREKLFKLYPDNNPEEVPFIALRKDLAIKLIAECHPETEKDRNKLHELAEKIGDKVAWLTNGATRYADTRTWKLDIRDIYREKEEDGASPHTWRLNIKDRLKGQEKRDFQVIRATDGLDRDCKRVKISDQSASIIDDIFFCELPGPGKINNKEILANMHNRELAFALKAYDVSNAAAGFDKRDPLFIFFTRLFVMVHELYDTAVDAVESGDYSKMNAIRGEARRPGFLHKLRTGKAVEKESYIGQLRARTAPNTISAIITSILPEDVVHWHPKNQQNAPGFSERLERVTLSKGTETVVGCRIITSDTESTDIAGKLRGAIEASDHNVHVTTKTYPIHAKDGTIKNVRDFHIKSRSHATNTKIKAGIPLGNFIGMADSAGAIVEKDYADEIEYIKNLIKNHKPGLIK